eukprot:CAMPEP_0194734884 /NCGR_PEP_ID=MMETSP0296-20130528/71437_1 /TAXON_ID=39354 /ORGANISM="Heterosigma akashiwo, Strain CCMP2393" /LENGTH=76 /DNA_ID=CAMNT_0039643857 /DNA_START=153 /DNA_END=381 /DNA_ORIENTATION=-
MGLFQIFTLLILWGYRASLRVPRRSELLRPYLFEGGCPKGARCPKGVLVVQADPGREAGAPSGCLARIAAAAAAAP